MLAVKVSHIVKAFADKIAVDDLSFSVAQGETCMDYHHIQ